MIIGNCFDRPLACAALIAVVLSAAATSPASAMVDQAVRDALALDAAGHAAQAYDTLAPMAARRAGDPDFDYALGLTAVDSGKAAQGIVALQRVLAVQPNNGPARAQIARAYAMAGDIDTARREYSTVAGDPTIPDPVRQQLNRIVGSMNKAADGGLDVTGYVEAGAGYDSNVNAATSADTLTIPLFASLGPATLSPSAQAQDAMFGRVEGGVSGVYGLDRQSRVFASLLGSTRFQSGDAKDYNQILATATAGYAYSLANHDVASASVQSQQFWLGGDRFRHAEGVSAQYTHLLPPERGLIASVQHFKLRYVTMPLRDADRDAVGLNYVDKQLFVGVQFGREKTDDATVDDLSNRFGGVRLSLEQPLSNTLTAFGNLGFESRRYDAPDPLFLKVRKDSQIDGAVGLRYRLAERLSLIGQATYTHNDSNIDLDQYNRFTAGVSVRSEF